MPGDEWVEIRVDGKLLRARAGERLLTSLVKAGYKVLHRTPRRAVPGPVVCAKGTCYECLVTVNGREMVQACMTRVRAGLEVELDESWQRPA